MADNTLNLDGANKLLAIPDKHFSDSEMTEALANNPDLASALVSKLKGAGKTAAEVVPKVKDLTSSLGTDIQDFGRGAAQGATLGGESVIAGGLGALGSQAKAALSGNTGALFDTKKWLDAYRKNQQEAEASNEQAKARSPWLYGGGELAGTVGLGALTGGAGLEAGAGEMTLAQAAKAGAGTLAGELGDTLATGAAIGGTSGALSSKSNLDTAEGRQKVLADALGGAAGGAILNTGLRGLSEAGSGALGAAKEKLGKFINNQTDENAFLAQTGRAFQRGTEGTALNQSQSSQMMGTGERSSAVKDVYNQLTGAVDTVGKKLSALREQAGDNGITIKLGNQANDALGQLTEYLDKNPGLKVGQEAKSYLESLAGLKGDVSTDTFMENAAGVGTLNDVLHKGITPEAAFNLKNYIADLGRSTDDVGLKNSFQTLYRSIDDALDKNVPHYANVSDQWHKLAETLRDTVLKGSSGAETTGKETIFSANENSPEAYATKIREMLDAIRSPGMRGDSAKTGFNNLMTSMADYEKQFPGQLESLGVDPEALKQKLLKYGDDFSIARQVQGYDPQSSPTTNIKTGLLANIASTGRGTVIGTANAAGRILNAATPATNAVVKTGQALYQAPDEVLSGIADALKGAGLDSMGNALMNGITNKNQQMKNAALFTILQNPKSRMLISGEDVGQKELNLSGIPK